MSWLSCRLGIWGPLSVVTVVAVRPVVTTPSIATVSVSVVAVPGISISIWVGSGSWLSLGRSLSIVTIVAIGPVVATPSVATVAIAVPGVSLCFSISFWGSQSQGSQGPQQEKCLHDWSLV